MSQTPVQLEYSNKHKGVYSWKGPKWMQWSCMQNANIIKGAVNPILHVVDMRVLLIKTETWILKY